METLLGLLAVVIGVAIALVPLVIRVTAMAATSLIAAGVTVTLLGLALSHRAMDVWRAYRSRD